MPAHSTRSSTAQHWANSKQNTPCRTSHSEHSHGLYLTPSYVGEYQVLCQGFSLCHLWLCVPATIQAQDQRSDVYVCDHTYQRELNGITPVKIVKVLGEGGFSFVYLAQDEASGVSASSCDRVLPVVTADAKIGLAQKEFALKKIRCPTGTEGVELVMREVAAYRRFKCVLARPHS
jgi:hypothetical protein